MPDAASPAATPTPVPAVTDPATDPTPDSIEGQLASLTARVAALETEIAADHAQADPGLTLGAKVTKLFVTIFGSDEA